MIIYISNLFNYLEGDIIDCNEQKERINRYSDFHIHKRKSTFSYVFEQFQNVKLA